MSAPIVHFPAPVVREVGLSPVEVARGLRHLPGMVFLDTSSADFIEGSVRPDAGYSLVAAKPVRIVRGRLERPDDVAVLNRVYEEHRGVAESPDRGFPIGGAVGWIEYGGKFVFGIYPEMLVFDHRAGVWLETGTLSREIDLTSEASPFYGNPGPSLNFSRRMSAGDFCKRVERAQEYIAAGDIYQVNLSHRFTAKWPQAFGADSFPLYEKLRDASPAPFSAFLDLDDRQVLSSSPELFLRMSGSSIRTRPIKGTRPRFRDPARDEKSAYDLLTSPKEVAELIMITDLERNDLGQICEFGSVQAVDLLKLERYEQVFHLVSTVEGMLRPGIDHLAALTACFPGGSVTGAPKKRAREIIAELEPEPRGLYTGAIGILGFNGESRFNIAIRTAIREGDELHFHAGAGIVADSVPEAEYEETLHKAAGILQACGDG